MKEYKNKRKFTIILGRCYPGPDEENWPTKENTACTHVLYSKSGLYRKMKELINYWAAPWWWIFDGDIDEDNLILSGAVDPDDIYIVKENLS